MKKLTKENYRNKFYYWKTIALQRQNRLSELEIRIDNLRSMIHREVNKLIVDHAMNHTDPNILFVKEKLHRIMLRELERGK